MPTPIISNSTVRWAVPMGACTISGQTYFAEQIAINQTMTTVDVAGPSGTIVGAHYIPQPMTMSATLQWATSTTQTPIVGNEVCILPPISPTGTYIVTSVGQTFSSKDIAKLAVAGREKL
jgi:hypothetical protein